MIYLFLFTAVVFVVFSLKYAWWKPAKDWKYPRVLMYHMVREHIKGAKFNKLRVKPIQFEKQIAWMKSEGYTFVTMQTLVQNWGKHPEKTVALTFDDGYLDNLTNALPILKKYDVPATIYVVVDRHDRDWSTYKKAHHNSGELMREKKLSNEQLMELVESGLIEIGSHTITHANLNLLDDILCEQEMRNSKEQLQTITGQSINSFAYPFGIYSERDVEVAKKIGYTNAVTTIEGIDGNNPDMMQLQRIKISGKDSIFAVRLRLRLGKRS